MTAWKSLGVPNLTGTRIIVTGANTGLGYQSALAFVRAGAGVVLAVRNLDKGDAAAARLIADVPGAQVRVARLDLADLASVRRFADAEGSRGPIDVLVNNAGLMLVPRRELTSDGFESHMGVNHLGHFALTSRLWPALRDTARVVSVSSLAHWSARRLDHGLNLTGSYTPMGAYGQSKLAVLMFAVELDRRLRAAGSPVRSVAAHPGWSATEVLARDDKPGPIVAFSRKATAVLGSSAADGARSQIRAAVGPGVQGGQLIGPAQLVRGRPHDAAMSPAARDQAAAAWLWERSEALTGVAFGALVPPAR